jgi:hypothetical protein
MTLIIGNTISPTCVKGFHGFAFGLYSSLSGTISSIVEKPRG